MVRSHAPPLCTENKQKFIDKINPCKISLNKKCMGFTFCSPMNHSRKSPNDEHLMHILISHLLASCLIEILRGNELISESNKYTPGQEDRGGITAKCSDTVHSKWRTTEDTVKSEELRPHCKFK